VNYAARDMFVNHLTDFVEQVRFISAVHHDSLNDGKNIQRQIRSLCCTERK